MSKTTVITEQDEIMTVREVAEYLKVAESTVYRLARQGRVPSRKVGGAWRFSRRALDLWIDNQDALFVGGARRPPPAASPDSSIAQEAPTHN